MTRRFLPIALLLAIAALIQIAGYWPGVMIWDAIHQYEQSLSGHYTDWHPPILQWLWRRMLPIAHGPAPMLVLQLLLYWGGYALLIAGALREKHMRVAVLLALAAILPIPLALMGAIIKDCLMAGALLAATGLLLWQKRGGWVVRVAAAILLLFAAALRFNGVVAAIPFAVAFLPPSWRSGRKLVLAILGVSVPLALALPLTERALHVEKTGVGLSLVTFDLGGITYHSGTDVFPPLAVADPVAVNRRCYSPELWDPYSWWVADPCPIQFEDVRAFFAAHRLNPYRWWAGAVATHPLAYAEHRLAHFNINSAFLIARLPTRPIFDETNANPWGFRTVSNPAMRWIDRAARYSALTPLGWPIWWMALSAGILAIAGRLEERRVIIPLAASSLLYGLSYLPLSVASETRYHLWTMMAGALAAAFAAGDPKLRWVGWRRLLSASMLLMLVTIFGTVSRL